MTPAEIKEARRKLGLPGKQISQERLARQLGVTTSLVSKWEGGTRSIDGPALILLKRLIEEAER